MTDFTGAIFDENTTWEDGVAPEGAVDSGTVTTGYLNFQGANLTDAQFSGVDLNGANFTGANLSGTQFQTDDSGTPTTLTDVTFGTLGDVDGDGVLDLPVFDANTTFTDVTFGGATVSGTVLSPAVGLAIHESLGTTSDESKTHLQSMGFTDNTVIDIAVNNPPLFNAPAEPVSITRNNNVIDFTTAGPYFTDADGNPPDDDFRVIPNGTLPKFATLVDNRLTVDYSSIANYGNIYNINLQTTPDSDPHERVTSGTLSVAIGDPYIYPMRSSIPVKLPDAEACYRLYQSNKTFINAEVAVATKEHENRMMEFVEKLGEDTKDVIADGYFFSKFFIADGKNKMVVDLREKSFSLVEGSDKTFFNISQNNSNAGNKDWNGKAKNVVVEWVTEEGNQMKATVSFFANPHIENGISLSVSNLPQKALGLCVSNYRPKLMRVPSLTTEKHGKISRQVKKSRNPFQKIAIQSNREKWIMKK